MLWNTWELLDNIDNGAEHLLLDSDSVTPEQIHHFLHQVVITGHPPLEDFLPVYASPTPGGGTDPDTLPQDCRLFTARVTDYSCVIDPLDTQDTHRFLANLPANPTIGTGREPLHPFTLRALLAWARATFSPPGQRLHPLTHTLLAGNNDNETIAALQRELRRFNHSLASELAWIAETNTFSLETRALALQTLTSARVPAFYPLTLSTIHTLCQPHINPRLQFAAIVTAASHLPLDAKHSLRPSIEPLASSSPSPDTRRAAQAFLTRLKPNP